MNSLKEYLYSYLMEYICEAERTDEEYQLARKLRDAAGDELCAALTPGQQQLLSRYIDEANYVSSLELHRMFRVTLALLRGELC